MEYLRNWSMYLGQRVLGFRNKQTSREVTRSEAYLNVLYKILSWEQPKLSFITLLILLFLLWFIVHLEIKLYGIIFFSMIIILLGDYYLEQKNFHVDHEESAELMHNIQCYFSDTVIYLKAIRKKYPMPFCIVMCMLFLWLTVIARNISGVTLTYLGLIALFVGPTLVARLPSEYVQSFKECLHTIGSNQGVLAESELIPYLSIKDPDNDLESLQTDHTMDSISDSLISGITSMPSYLEAEKDIEEDDLELPFRLTRESSTDTDSDKKSMDFESSHFNGDSSSEDESKYQKGLKFSDVTAELPASASNTKSGILKNLTILSGNFISNVLQTKPKRKDSDSDFEIIDPDEVANS